MKAAEKTVIFNKETELKKLPILHHPKIKSGGIWYKKADIHEVSVNIVDNTAILLNRITLLAEVGGIEVSNPFMVTEVYLKQGENGKLGSLSFTKLLQ